MYIYILLYLVVGTSPEGEGGEKCLIWVKVAHGPFNADAAGHVTFIHPKAAIRPQHSSTPHHARNTQQPEHNTQRASPRGISAHLQALSCHEEGPGKQHKCQRHHQCGHHHPGRGRRRWAIQADREEKVSGFCCRILTDNLFSSRITSIQRLQADLAAEEGGMPSTISR